MTRATTSYSGFATICPQDARLISRSAHGSIQYGFVTDRFKKLRNGQVTISGPIREWEQGPPHQCVFCGLPTDHLIPRNSCNLLGSGVCNV